MIYSVRHVTRFRYEPEVREIVMELRMQPRNEGYQRCLNFDLELNPPANLMQHRDYLGNVIHHFDIAGAHREITVTSKALVELQPSSLPDASATGDWKELDNQVGREDHWDMLIQSHFAKPTERLNAFAQEIGLARRDKPLQVLVDLTRAIYDSFAYAPQSTKVDSPIDHALESRQGVCQDFAHIMIALARKIHVPCRYVSGYLVPAEQNKDRSPDGASHAWVEALIPKLGWVAFDPTNNLVAGDRHIRVAIGRDYADVPPNRGVYKGDAESELSVAVSVAPADVRTVTVLNPGVVTRTPPVRVMGTRKRAAQEQQQQ